MVAHPRVLRTTVGVRQKKMGNRHRMAEWGTTASEIWWGTCDDITKCRGTAYRYAMGGNLATIYDWQSYRHLVLVSCSYVAPWWPFYVHDWPESQHNANKTTF